MIRLTYPAGMWPTEWMISFRNQTPSRLVRWLAVGRYKHVACFGYVPAVDAFLIYDVGLNGTSIIVAPNERADVLLGPLTDDALVLRFVPSVVRTRAPLKPAFCCTTAVAHMVGIRSCALRPDAFLKDCLANGAEIVIPDPCKSTALSRILQSSVKRLRLGLRISKPSATV